MVIQDITKYNLSDFSIDIALTGGLIFARKDFSDNDTKYYLVSNFKANNTLKQANYKYVGVIEDNLVYFNEEGISVDGTFILKMANSVISGGNTKGDIITRAGEGDESENSYTLTTLNYRENIAKEVLGFLINNIKNPDSLTDAKITYLISAAFKYSFEFVNQAINLRNNNKEIEEKQEEAIGDSSAVDESTFWNLLLSKLGTIQTTLNKMYSTETPIKIQGSGGSSTGGNTDLTDLIQAIQNLSSINIGNSGLGKDQNNPIYISGDTFPTRNALAGHFNSSTLHDFLTFNEAGAVGYSSLSEVKTALLDFIDNRIKAWLQSAKVTINGNNYSITIVTPS